MNKQKEFFTINVISRQDLYNHLGKDKADNLTDAQMERIASRMGDYSMDWYWDYAESACDIVLED